MAGNHLMSISQNERERAIFRKRRMYQTDMQSDLATAEDRGKMIGRTERDVEIVYNALKMNTPIDAITRLTGLIHEGIANIQDLISS